MRYPTKSPSHSVFRPFSAAVLGLRQLDFSETRDPGSESGCPYARGEES
jgi:hypothetical protein